MHVDVFMFVPGRGKELQVGMAQACYSTQHSITQQLHEKRIILENHPSWCFPLLRPLCSLSLSLSFSFFSPAVCVSGIHLSVVSAREWYRELSLLISLHWWGLLQLPCLTRGQRKCVWGRRRGRGVEKKKKRETGQRGRLERRVFRGQESN